MPEKKFSIFTSILVFLFLITLPGKLCAYLVVGKMLSEYLKKGLPEEHVEMVVGLDNSPQQSEAFDSYDVQGYSLSEYRRLRMIQLREKHKQARQKMFSLIRYLKAYGEDIRVKRSLWLANALVIRATVQSARKFVEENKSSDQSKLARSIHLRKVFRIVPTVKTKGTETQREDELRAGYTRGLMAIGLDVLNEQYPVAEEYAASGLPPVRIGIIDSGVDFSHPDLSGKINIDCSKDFIADESLLPLDDSSHGTHVAGSIIGGSSSGVQIGVANRGSELCVAKVFDESGYAKEEKIIEAMEYMMDPDGNPDTDDAPVVVNNSWGGNLVKWSEERPFYTAVVNWIELGIFPCFAAGNEGEQGLGSIANPAGFPIAFSVGATDGNGSVADFSGRGPSIWQDRNFMKPDVVAPGSNVYSSVPGNDWEFFSGTSMAAPHVSGLVALLIQAARLVKMPELTIGEISETIRSTVKDIGSPGHEFDSGWGRIDALAAVTKVLERGQREGDDIPI